MVRLSQREVVIQWHHCVKMWEVRKEREEVKEKEEEREEKKKGEEREEREEVKEEEEREEKKKEEEREEKKGKEREEKGKGNWMLQILSTRLSHLMRPLLLR